MQELQSRQLAILTLFRQLMLDWRRLVLSCHWGLVLLTCYRTLVLLICFARSLLVS